MSKLKKIMVSDLRVGMFLHGFDGPWLKHPFWKSKYLVSELADLRAAQNSGVQCCWIDTAKGDDVRLESAATPPAAELTTASSPTAPSPANVAGHAPFEDELLRAATLCRDARKATEGMFNEARMGRAIDPVTLLPLVNDIAESVLRHPGALISLARLKTRDDYTYMHSVAVCALMIALGQEMGMNSADSRDAGLAGLLHDIGKCLVPLDILNKPGKLTDAEFEIVKNHSILGHELLFEGKTASAAILDVCLHHHEKMDGSGYPHGLQGKQISLMARMGAICDVYDAITSNRAYKPGWDPAESVAKMISWRGHFDQTILSAFIKTLGIYPTGALVQMRSGRIAVVVEQNKSSLTKPVVKVFFSTKSQARIPAERIDLTQPGCNDAIVARAARDSWDTATIEQLWAGEVIDWSSKV